MRSSRTLIGLGIAGVLLVGCAAGVNPAAHTADAAGIVAGFWRGLWHGMIAPITFIVSLFQNTVQVYEVHNDGGWYNFGFLLGMGMFHGGPRAAHHGRRWRKRQITTVTTLSATVGSTP